MRLRIVLLGVIFLSLFVSTYSQTAAQIERELVAHYESVEKASTYGSSYDQETLTKEIELFKQNLLRYAAEQPATLQYRFPKLAEHIQIATSEDDKFRIYSWDTQDGGTMHFFDRVYQFRGTDGKVYSRADKPAAEGDAGSFVYAIYTQNTKNGEVYLVCSTAILSTADSYQAVGLYRIENSALNDKIKLFKTKSGLTDSIGFEYDFFSVVDRKERPIKLILYDRKTQTVKIPVVIEDAKFRLGKVTDRFINYTFDGTYFVRAR